MTVNEIWKRLFCYESNLLSFNAAFHLGHPVWDGQYKALTYAIEMGINRNVADVCRTHTYLTEGVSKSAGLLRTSYAGVNYPAGEDVPVLLQGWLKVASGEALTQQNFKYEKEAHKRILKLHYDLIRIRPFDNDNERLARILAVNLCLKAEVDPLMFYFESRDSYKAPLISTS